MSSKNITVYCDGYIISGNCDGTEVVFKHADDKPLVGDYTTMWIDAYKLFHYFSMAMDFIKDDLDVEKRKTLCKSRIYFAPICPSINKKVIKHRLIKITDGKYELIELSGENLAFSPQGKSVRPNDIAIADELYRLYIQSNTDCNTRFNAIMAMDINLDDFDIQVSPDRKKIIIKQKEDVQTISEGKARQYK